MGEHYVFFFGLLYFGILLLWARFCTTNLKLPFLALFNILSYGLLLLYFNSGWLLLQIYLMLFIGFWSNTQNIHKRFRKVPSILIPLIGLYAIQYMLPRLSGQIVNPDLFAHATGESLALGLSYVCFRMLLFSVEKERNEGSLSFYLAYVLFLPTCIVGPLTKPRLFEESVRNTKGIKFKWPFVERILWGTLKATLICGMFDRISFQGIIFDGNSHSWWALPIACIGFYLYLYCNFSGVCDMVIAGSAIVGIHLDENFNNPLLSTNLSDFWRRWHITLGTLFRNLVYAPLALIGLRSSQGKIPLFWSSIASLVTFLAIGLWHGFEWKWLVFGLIHGFGVIIHMLFIELKLKWDKKGIFAQFFESKCYLFLSWLLTQLYVAGSMFFFANELSQISSLRTILVW